MKNKKEIVILILTAVICLVLGFFAGRLAYKKHTASAETVPEETVVETETETTETESAFEPIVIPEEVANPSVKDFVYADTSRVFIQENGENRREITDYVTNYSKGDLSVTDNGLCVIFPLKKVAVTDEDVELYKKQEKESGFDSFGNDYIKLSGDGTDLILKEGSRFYICGGKGAVLTGAVTKENGKVSVPVNNLVFALGYTSLGVSAEADSVIYNLIK